MVRIYFCYTFRYKCNFQHFYYVIKLRVIILLYMRLMGLVSFISFLDGKEKLYVSWKLL